MADMIYATIPTAPGYAVRVSRSEYRGRVRLDIRHVFEAEPGAPGPWWPTKRGVSLLVERLPELLHALRELERDAIRRGELLAEDYETAGLPVPPELAGKGEAA